MAERFHVNCDLGPGLIDLDGPEAHHLATVCRLRPGDRVCLFNGDGREYPALVEQVERRSVALRVLSVESPSRELPFRLEVAAALPKGDRAQVLVEKLTELGVTAFIPLRTSRSIVQPRETRLDRLQRHVIEASKQCGRNVLMVIEPLTEWADYSRGERPARKLLAHPGGEEIRGAGGDGDITVAVGPEGGFTDEEVSLALGAGWRVVGLGPRILRVETAAVGLASLLTLSR